LRPPKLSSRGRYYAVMSREASMAATVCYSAWLLLRIPAAAFSLCQPQHSRSASGQALTTTRCAVRTQSRALTSRMPQRGTYGRAQQAAPVVTSLPAAAAQPMIGVAALLQLVDWLHARRPRHPQGGSSCVNLEPPLSPPAPAPGNTPEQAEPTVVGLGGQRPRTASTGAQPRRGRSPRVVSSTTGGDA